LGSLLRALLPFRQVRPYQRHLPSNLTITSSYKIWKKGSSLRADSTLVGYGTLPISFAPALFNSHPTPITENLNWVRGHWSVLFNGDSTQFKVLPCSVSWLTNSNFQGDTPDLHIIDYDHKRIESAIEALKEDVAGKVPFEPINLMFL